jgi:hypothetical protein
MISLKPRGIASVAAELQARKNSAAAIRPGCHRDAD